MHTLGAFFITYAGFVALSLLISRQRKQLLPAIQTLLPKDRWALRIAGWTALLVGMVLCLQQYGFSVGLTLWIGLLTAAAFTLSMLALYAPRFALGLLPCALLPLFVAW